MLLLRPFFFFFLVVMVGVFETTFTNAATSCVQVVDFMTDCGATTNSPDNSAQWELCVQLANSSGLPIYIPPFTFNFNRSISSSGVKVEGAGSAVSILYWTVDAAVYHTPSWTISSIVPGDTWVRGLGLSSVCGRQALGINGCNRDGIWLNSAVELNTVQIQGFLSGLVWNSSTGHTVSFGCDISNNYYGLYMANSGGYNIFMAGSMAGNTMASIGIPANGHMGPGDLIWRTHLGFGPYGVYQEGFSSLAKQVFLKETIFYLARFEACGNGAVYSENAASGSGILDSVQFLNVGASWDNNYRISNRSADYAVYVGGVNPQAIYHSIQGGSGFTGQGKMGAWYLGPSYGDDGGLDTPDFVPVNETV